MELAMVLLNRYPLYLRSCGILVKGHCLKKGKHNPGNYISVSLTLVVSKIMEHILLEIMWRHMENHDSIDDNQCGFTKGKSCLTNLVASCNGVLVLVGEGRAVGVIYPYFCKACNKVTYKVLFSKLYRYGFDGQAT